VAFAFSGVYAGIYIFFRQHRSPPKRARTGTLDPIGLTIACQIWRDWSRVGLVVKRSPVPVTSAHTHSVLLAYGQCER